MDYIAHKRNVSDGKEQLLITHLKNTAELCAKFANCINLYDYGYFVGMLHDIGKYCDSFQKRVRGAEIKVEHSTSGAKEAFIHKHLMAAFCISGHHGGLPDIGNKSDNFDNGTLFSKMMRTPEDYSYWENEQNKFISDQITEPPSTSKDIYNYVFLIRVMFSCLVDADFLDTEAFMSDNNIQRLCGNSIDELLSFLNQFISKWSNPIGKLNTLRSQMLTECIECGKQSNKNLFTLTVPTGGGKTVSSLAFALNYAKLHNKKRIIYVIPYTSIIEQNADVFRNILGDKNVIENHCNVDLSTELSDEIRTQKFLACENWDAPVIVTTAVQFFESIYSAKTSKCRKIHNMADSVIIFDEAQMLPISYLLPCVSAIWELTQCCNSTAVLCTATQPSLDKFFKHLNYKENFYIPEICTSAKDAIEDFKRAEFRFDGKLDDDVITARLSENNQVLCIVNKKAHAKKLFSMLQNSDNNFHLSTHMYPNHRKAVITEIKTRLSENKPCRVISTTLIEAGVDIDFPVVYRAISGIDSILQAGGRCNRENQHSADESIVHIFDTDEIVSYQELNVSISRKIIDKYGNKIYQSEAIKEYFDALNYYKDTNNSLNVFDKKGIMKNIEKCNFSKISKDFKLIENNTKTVYVPTTDNNTYIEDLRNGRYSKELFRNLQHFSVNLYDYEFKKLDDVGAIEIIDNDFFVLANNEYYSKDTGIIIPNENCGVGIFI